MNRVYLPAAQARHRKKRIEFGERKAPSGRRLAIPATVGRVIQPDFVGIQ
jgi:hypothetical protein